MKEKLPSSGFFTNSTPKLSNLLQALYTSSTVTPMCPESRPCVKILETTKIPEKLKVKLIPKEVQTN